MYSLDDKIVYSNEFVCKYTLLIMVQVYKFAMLTIHSTATSFAFLMQSE